MAYSQIQTEMEFICSHVMIGDSMKKAPLYSVSDLRKNCDLTLLGICLALSIIGFVLIFSSTRYLLENRNRYIIIQVIGTVVGILTYFIISLIDLNIFSDRLKWCLIALSFISIGLLLTPWGTGGETTGNRNWLSFPFLPINIQPAEFVKIPYVIVLSHFFSTRPPISISNVIFPASYAILLCLEILIISKDFGMVLIYAGTFLILAWCAGLNKRWFLLSFLFVCVLSLIIWPFIPKYIKMRILVVFDHSLDPIHFGWQQERSLLAIGSGGLCGQGFLNGTQTQSAEGLPARYTDEIFAVCGEEFGFLGCLLVIVILSLLIIRCGWIAVKSINDFRRYVAIGFSGLFALQIIINLGMCLYIFPVVGITLPFISYGGSSILASYASVGFVSSCYSWLRKK